MCDVGNPQQVQRLAETAFHYFDTWVNNAGISIFGEVWDVPMDAWRRMFETTYWGQVHGSLAAVRHYRSRGEPGAIVNVGSFFGDRAPPVQNSYASAKFASILGYFTPRLADKIMERMMYTSHQSRTRKSNEDHERALSHAGYGGQERGTHEPHLLRKRSYYVEASKHPALTLAALVGGGALAWSLLRPRDEDTARPPAPEAGDMAQIARPDGATDDAPETEEIEVAAVLVPAE